MEGNWISFILMLTISVVPYRSELIRVNLQRTKSAFQSLLESNIHPQMIERMLSNGTDKNVTVPLWRYMDNEFYGEILLGHPGQKFKVVFDTAWANSWVPSSLCPVTDVACDIHNKYISGKSSTHKEDGRQIRIDFVNYYLSGVLDNDLLHIGQANVSNQIFAEMTHLPWFYMLNKADGVLGLAFKSISYLGVTPFIDNMVEQNVISKKIFSLYFNRDKSSAKGGTLLLGGSDPDHYLGNFTYVNLIANDFWRIQIPSINVKGSTENLCNTSCGAIIDTSSTIISGPTSAITRLSSLIKSKPFVFGKYMVDCGKVGTLPAITFNIGGRDFILKSRDYVKKFSWEGFTLCLTVFESNDIPAPLENYWTLGAAFMARFYVEFDAENSRVGFADIRQ